MASILEGIVGLSAVILNYSAGGSGSSGFRGAITGVLAGRNRAIRGLSVNPAPFKDVNCGDGIGNGVKICVVTTDLADITSLSDSK